MVLKQESRLNGVKTNVFNLEDVAKSLKVPAEGKSIIFTCDLAMMKFWCHELGTSKEKSSILKGQHNYETMLKMLDKFIEKYLLCTKCNLPETQMFYKNK